MYPPKDPIIIKSGFWQDSEIYEVVGNIYGLVNAPYEWCMEVMRRMYDLGFVSHSLDVMMFMSFDESGRLSCLGVFHVDDVLITWAPWFDIQKLRDSFEWGSWHDDGQVMVYCGREIRVDHEHGHVHVCQSTFAKSTDVRAVSRDRLRSEQQALTSEERTEFRSCTGSLQYLSSNTRPALAAGTSLVQKGDLEISDLQEAYRLVEYANGTAEVGICIKPVDLTQACIVGHGDSSWANAEGHRTQTGFCVFVTSMSVLQAQTPCSLVDWRSARTKRVVRSTLAAEAIASDTCSDHAFFVAASLSEILSGAKATLSKPTLPCYVCTDCKSLYDALQKITPSLDERRTLIDVLSIRQTISELGGLRWIPTTEQLADALTKVDVKLMIRLATFIGDGNLR